MDKQEQRQERRPVKGEKVRLDATVMAVSSLGVALRFANNDDSRVYQRWEQWGRLEPLPPDRSGEEVRAAYDAGEISRQQLVQGQQPPEQQRPLAVGGRVQAKGTIVAVWPNAGQEPTEIVVDFGNSQRVRFYPDEFQRIEQLGGTQQPASEPATTYDLVAHLERQRTWSVSTFGPGSRAQGVLEHIRKELREIEANPTDLTEWIDVVLLALDGAWRSGCSPAEIAAALEAKQAKNESRQWPDWRSNPNGAIEHIREQPPQPPAGEADGAVDLDDCRFQLIRKNTGPFEYFVGYAAKPVPDAPNFDAVPLAAAQRAVEQARQQEKEKALHPLVQAYKEMRDEE